MSLKKTSKSILSITMRSAVYILLIALLVYLGSKAYVFGQKLFSEQGYEESPGRDVTITISAEESNMQVAEKLVQNGIVGNKMVFYFQTLLYEGEYKPGTYTLNTSSSAEDIIEYLSEEHTEEETGTEGN